MNDHHSTAKNASRRTRTVMLRFTDQEFETIKAAQAPEFEIAVFLRNVAMARLVNRESSHVYEALASLVSTYGSEMRFGQALYAVKELVRKRESDNDKRTPDNDTAQLRNRNVMLRFTDEEYEKILTVRRQNRSTAVFLRNLILESLADGPAPGLRESVAFVISSLLPDVSFEEVLEKFDRVAKPRSVTHEAHQESERTLLLASHTGLAGNV